MGQTVTITIDVDTVRGWLDRAQVADGDDRDGIAAAAALIAYLRASLDTQASVR